MSMQHPYRTVLSTRLGQAAPVVLALILGACSSEPEESARAARETSTRWQAQLEARPQQVLDGSRTVPLERLLPKVRPVALRGMFEGEWDGARGSIRLEWNDHQGMVLVRRFEAPGQDAHEKIYPGLKARAQEGQWLKGPGIDVLGMKRSIAVLESEPGVDGIPSSRWVIYRRARTASR